MKCVLVTLLAGKVVGTSQAPLNFRPGFARCDTAQGFLTPSCLASLISLSIPPRDRHLTQDPIPYCMLFHFMPPFPIRLFTGSHKHKLGAHVWSFGV